SCQTFLRSLHFQGSHNRPVITLVRFPFFQAIAFAQGYNPAPPARADSNRIVYLFHNKPTGPAVLRQRVWHPEAFANVGLWQAATCQTPRSIRRHSIVSSRAIS